MPVFDSDFEQNLYQLRREKLAEIARLTQAAGRPTQVAGTLTYAEATYPNRFPATGTADTIPEIRRTYEHAPAEEFELAAAEGKPIHATVAGRIMAIRLQGKAGFAQLQQAGERLQIYVRKDDVGETTFALYKLLDLGDHIGVRGTLMRTRTGELTLKALPLEDQPAITFLAKAMLALPDKYHGLEDVELRYRQRYVDLIMNSGTLTKQELSPPTNPTLPVTGPGPATSPATPTSKPVILSEGAHTVSAIVEGPAVPPTSASHSTPVNPSAARNPSIPSAQPSNPPETTATYQPAASPGSSPALDALLEPSAASHGHHLSAPPQNPVILSGGAHPVSTAVEGPRNPSSLLNPSPLSATAPSSLPPAHPQSPTPPPPTKNTTTPPATSAKSSSNAPRSSAPSATSSTPAATSKSKPP